MPPVLLVHGIHDTPRTFRKCLQALERSELAPAETVALTPNDGSCSLKVLAAQVDHAARNLLQTTGAPKIDLVGFSMGSLVSRYWLQRLGGKDYTRRFISISGPHAGTWTAHLSGKPGIREMRPQSAFLQDLEADPHPFGDVDVHVLFTPLDLMIVPAKSSLLEHAKSTEAIPVVLHPLMLSDARVLSKICELLKA